MRWGLLLVLISTPSLWAQSELAGEWMVTIVEFGQPDHTRLVLKPEGGKLSGMLSGRPVEVSVNGKDLGFKDQNVEAKGVFDGRQIIGKLTRRGSTSDFKAERIPPPPAQPRTHDFEPSRFELYFSAAPKPVLRIYPGDTVRTWGVDAGGIDAKGVRRSLGGNPQTGPFFIEGALPGDTLVVRLNKVRLNRDWAVSGSSVMFDTLQPGHLSRLEWAKEFSSRWTLDREKGVAHLEKPTDKLKNFSVPLAPMAGCVGVAPPGDWSIRTVDSGRFGGNMDYNQIREGTTLYLPVFHPGALLFIGDGHAAQGDGELTGDALETSMDFDFTVDLIKGRQFGHPLAENSEYLISIGIGGSLPAALQMATSGMMRWLDHDYKLSPSESAIVMGFALKYDIVDLVGSQVSIAAKVPKTALSRLEKAGAR